MGGHPANARPPNQLFLYFPGVVLLYFFKCTYKIAQIIKSISICNICNRIIGCGDFIAGSLNALPVQIIHGSLMVISEKKRQKYLGDMDTEAESCFDVSEPPYLVVLNEIKYLFQL